MRNIFPSNMRINESKYERIKNFEKKWQTRMACPLGLV
jgi:hypothetical protein